MIYGPPNGFFRIIPAEIQVLPDNIWVILLSFPTFLNQPLHSGKSALQLASFSVPKILFLGDTINRKEDDIQGGIEQLFDILIIICAILSMC